MTTSDETSGTCRPPTADELGDKLMQEIGGLNEASQDLGRDDEDEGTEPEEIGRWITAIGRAILAIFKR